MVKGKDYGIDWDAVESGHYTPSESSSNYGKDTYSDAAGEDGKGNNVEGHSRSDRVADSGGGGSSSSSSSSETFGEAVPNLGDSGSDSDSSGGGSGNTYTNNTTIDQIQEDDKWDETNDSTVTNTTVEQKVSEAADEAKNVVYKNPEPTINDAQETVQNARETVDQARNRVGWAIRGVSGWAWVALLAVVGAVLGVAAGGDS